MREVKHLIDGKSVESVNGRTYDRLNPVSGAIATQDPHALIGQAHLQAREQPALTGGKELVGQDQRTHAEVSAISGRRFQI